MPRSKKQTVSKPKRISKKVAAKSEANSTQAAVPEVTRKTGNWFRRRLVVVPVRARILPAPKLCIQSLRVLKDNRKLFLGIIAFYALVNFVLVGGVSESGITTAKHSLNLGTNHASSISKSSTLLGAMLSSTGNNANGASGAYQTMLVLIISVVLIWALRQVYAEHKIRVRDAFYKGPYPLIPFVLVLMLVGVELLPMLVGGALYKAFTGGGITIGLLEKGVSAAVFLALTVLSLYLVCSSLFALYIVTLPEMTPMKALRSARDLVRFRRWVVLRKLLFLPLVLFVVGVLIMLPVALYLTPLAAVVFFCLSVITLAVVHSYMYALYRELL